MLNINIICYYQVYIYEYDKEVTIDNRRIMIWGIMIIIIIHIELIIL